MKIRISRRDLPLITAFCIMLYAVIMLYSNWENVGYLTARDTTLHLVVLSFAVVVLNLVGWVRAGNRFVSLFTIFYLYLFLSNVGQQISLFFPDALYTGANIYTRFSTYYVNKWILYQLAGVAATGCGAVIISRWFNKKHIKSKDKINAYHRNKEFEMLLYAVYMCSMVASFAFAFRQLLMRQTLSYDDFRDVATGTNGITNFCFSCLSYYYIFKNKDHEKTLKKYLAPVIVLILCFFAAGTRSRAIPLVMMCVFCVREVKPELFKKRYIPVFAVGIILFLYFTNVISAVRENAMSSVGIADLFTKSLTDGVLNMIYEMGISTNCGLVTLRAIEGGSPHYQTLLYYFMRALVPGAILSIFGFNAPACGALSDWATEMGGFGYSIGFSCLAEAYVNYDVHGWIFMAFYGGIISYLELNSTKKLNEGKYLYPCVVLTLLAKQVFFARAQFDLISTYLRFSFIVLACYILFFYSKRRSKRYGYI